MAFFERARNIFLAAPQSLPSAESSDLDLDAVVTACCCAAISAVGRIVKTWMRWSRPVAAPQSLPSAESSDFNAVITPHCCAAISTVGRIVGLGFGCGNHAPLKLQIILIWPRAAQSSNKSRERS